MITTVPRCAHLHVCETCRVDLAAIDPPRLPYRQPQGATRELTERELAVLTLLARGLTRQQVGSRLDPPIAAMTVKTHLDRIYQALGIRSQAGAVAVAIRHGLI